MTQINYKPADAKTVNALADQIMPLVDGKAGNEIAQAFFLVMFRVGFSVGQDDAPILIAVPPEALTEKEDEDETKPKKKGKNYVN